MSERIYPQRPIAGVIAIVRRGERFLLVRRGREPNKGKWGFPGGVQELGETLVEAALRELTEETAVEAGVPEVLTTLDVIDRDGEGKVRYHYALVAIHLQWRAGEGTAGDDADALGWFEPGALDGGSTLPDVGRLMRLALDRRNACGGVLD